MAKLNFKLTFTHLALYWFGTMLHLGAYFFKFKDCSTQSDSLSPWALEWRHKECDGVSNHRRLDCLLNRLFRRRFKKTSKLRVTGLCEEISPVTGEFPAQRASNAENISIWWHCSYVTWRSLTMICLFWSKNNGTACSRFYFDKLRHYDLSKADLAFQYCVTANVIK